MTVMLTLDCIVDILNATMRPLPLCIVAPNRPNYCVYLEIFLAMCRIINNTDSMILSLVLHISQEVPCVTCLIVFHDKIVIAAT